MMKLIIRVLFLFVTGSVYSQEVDLTSYLPDNYSKNADVDYTKFLQKGINENRNVKMPNFTVLINKNGLQIPSNSILTFQENSCLKLIPSNSRTYDMLELENVENIIINDPKLEGERQESFDGKKRTGEWGMGISIRSSKNISIHNADLKNFWGDGIYFGTSVNNRKFSNTNIKIYNPKIYKARRNGISITNGVSILIENAQIYNTGGTSPHAAIDIEPNNNNNKIMDLKILNPKTGYGRVGIIISLKGLVGIQKQNVSILIDGHLDEHSNQSFRFAGYNKNEINKDLKPLDGRIEVKNATWKVGNGTFTYESPKNMFPEFLIENLTIVRNKNGKDVNDTNYQFKLKTMLKKQPKMDVITKRKQ